MLQGFYWDSFIDTHWTRLTSQAEELATYFDLIWVPQSGNCYYDNQMGYMPIYYFNHDSSFGSEKELRQMISTFRERGLGTIADVVINHRGQRNTWSVIPTETYKGETYQFLSTDICKNDDDNSTQSWAASKGLSLSENNDTGEGWGDAFDLDHKSANVNKTIKAYLYFLLNDLGYTGFRYDMVKGYSASFTADYNTAVHPKFSVGECWDGSTTIKNWINGTKDSNGVPTSAAFDFQFRYRVRDALHRNDWRLLSASNESEQGRPLIYDADYRPYAVTFVENHDTERRSNAEQDPLKSDTLAANAFMLAMPGTPCVFLKHWKAKKSEIKRMISVRKLVGLHNQSTFEILNSESMRFVVQTTGRQGSLICAVGKTASSYTAPQGFTKVVSGLDYAYFIPDALVSQWNPIEQRIAAEDEAELAAREAFQPHTATIYVRDELNWSSMNYYVWDSNNNTQLNGGWPGKEITSTVEIDGYTWYYQTFNVSSPDYYFNMVLSTGSGSPQTVDILGLSEDHFFVVKNKTFAAKYMAEDCTPSTGVTSPMASPREKGGLYDLTGRKVRTEQPLSKGIYIQNGKKLFIK